MAGATAPNTTTASQGAEPLGHAVSQGAPPYYSQPEAEDVRNRIMVDTKFKPVFIHRYPEAVENKVDPED